MSSFLFTDLFFLKLPHFLICFVVSETIYIFLRSIHPFEREGERSIMSRRERESQEDSVLSMKPDIGLDSRTPRPKPNPRVGHSTDYTSQVPL